MVATYPAAPKLTTEDQLTPQINMPVDQFGNPIPTTNYPTYAEIRNILSQPINIAALPTMAAPQYDPTKIGTETFERGLQYLQPIEGIRPETQTALNLIAERTRGESEAASSEAQALASRRGLAGSSIEQFGTAEAIGGVQEAGRTAETNLLLENLRQNEASRLAAGQALTNRSGVEAELESQRVQLLNQQEIAKLQAEANRGNQQAALELERRTNEANAISNELASIRNMEFAQNQLEVDKAIQERTLQLMQENINVSREMAEQQAQNDIVTSLVGAFGPAIAQSMIPSRYAAAAGGGIIASPKGGAIGSSAGGIGTGLATAGAGIAGGLLGQAAFQPTQKYDALGTGLGGIAGGYIGAAFGGPLGAGIGSFVGSGAGKFAARRIQGIGKLLRGEGTRTTKNIEREVKTGLKKVGQSLGFK